jgi:hypothetical protein
MPQFNQQKRKVTKRAFGSFVGDFSLYVAGVLMFLAGYVLSTGWSISTTKASRMQVFAPACMREASTDLNAECAADERAPKSRCFHRSPQCGSPRSDELPRRGVPCCGSMSMVWPIGF